MLTIGSSTDTDAMGTGDPGSSTSLQQDETLSEGEETVMAAAGESEAVSLEPTASGDDVMHSAEVCTGHAVSGIAHNSSTMAVEARNDNSIGENGSAGVAAAGSTPPLPAVAGMEPRELETLSTNMKKAVEKLNETRESYVADFQNVILSARPLLDGCRHEKVRLLLAASVASLSDALKQHSSKLTEHMQHSMYRLRLCHVDMHRKLPPSSRCSSTEEESHPASDDAEATRLTNGDGAVDSDGGGGGGGGLTDVQRNSALLHSAEEAADVALNTLFLIADDVLRFNKKLNDSIQPFAQRDLPGGAVQPYDLREKWLATAQDFSQLRSGGGLGRLDVQALSTPHGVRNEDYQSAVSRLKTNYKDYCHNHSQVVAMFPYTVPCGFCTIPGAVEAILKNRHCSEAEAKALVPVSSRSLCSRIKVPTNDDLVDSVNYTLIITGTRSLDSGVGPTAKMQAAYQLRREVVADIFRDSSQRSKTPEKGCASPVLAIDQSSDVVSEILNASRPDLAYLDVRIAALLIFGKANSITVSMIPTRYSTVTKDGTGVIVKVLFMINPVVDKIAERYMETTIQPPVLGEYQAEYVTRITPWQVSGPPEVTFSIREAQEVVINKRTGLQQKIGKFAENVKRRTSSFSSRNSEQRRSKFYCNIGNEEEPAVNGHESSDAIAKAQQPDQTVEGAPPAQKLQAGSAPYDGHAAALSNHNLQHEQQYYRPFHGGPERTDDMEYHRTPDSSHWTYSQPGCYDNANGVDDGKKYSAAALGCLLARSPAMDSSEPADHSTPIDPPPARQQSYSESNMAERKSWETRTIEGTFTQPPIPKGEEKRRARSDDPVCIENEKKYGNAYPPGMFDENSSSQYNTYPYSGSTASRDTMTNDTSGSGSGVNSVTADQQWHKLYSGDPAWDTPMSSTDTSLGSALLDNMSQAQDTSTRYNGALALPPAPSQERSPSSQVSAVSDAVSDADRADPSVGSTAAGLGLGTHIDTAGIKPTSALPSNQHGPFPSTVGYGDRVWSNSVLDDARHAYEVSSGPVSDQHARITSLGDVTAANQQLSANMEDLLPQNLFSGCASVNRSASPTGSVHSNSSGSGNSEKAFMDQPPPVQQRYNPLARAVNLPPPPKTATWPQVREKEDLSSIWSPQVEDASSQPDLRPRAEPTASNASIRSSGADVSIKGSSRSVASNDAFTHSGHPYRNDRGSDEGKLFSAGEPHPKSGSPPPPVPPHSTEKERVQSHPQNHPQPLPSRPVRRSVLDRPPASFQQQHSMHGPPPPSLRHEQHGGRLPPPPHPEHHGPPPHDHHGPPPRPGDWHHGQYENHMPRHHGDPRDDRGPPHGPPPPSYPAPRPPPWTEGHHQQGQFRPRQHGGPPGAQHGGPPGTHHGGPQHWADPHPGWNPSGQPRPQIPEHRPPPGHYDIPVYPQHHAPPPGPRHPYSNNYGPPEDRRPGTWERPSRHEREYMPDPYYPHHRHPGGPPPGGPPPGGPPPPQGMRGPRPTGPPHPGNYGPPPAVPARNGQGMGPPPPGEDQWKEEQWRRDHGHYPAYHPSGTATM